MLQHIYFFISLKRDNSRITSITPFAEIEEPLGDVRGRRFRPMERWRLGMIEVATRHELTNLLPKGASEPTLQTTFY